MNTIKVGDYYRSIQSKEIFYQVKRVTQNRVTLKTVYQKVPHEIEVKLETFSKTFTPAT